MFLMHRDSQCNSKSMLCIHISKKSAGSTYVDFKIGFLAKFCVIEGISEIMYIYILYIFSIRSFICPLVIPPGVIISGYIYMKISYIPNF